MACERKRMKTIPLLTLNSFAALALVCLILSGCSPGDKQTMPSASVNTCAFPTEAVIVKQEGPAILQYWEFEDSERWMHAHLPADSAFMAYRQAIEEAGINDPRPAQYVPEADQDNDIWRRELHNVDQAYSGEAGEVRPIRCLDALLFAFQNARISQIEQPTEFIASILRKQIADTPMLRVYFSASNTMFPPKEFYGFDEAQKDVEDGWEYVAALHNHTLQQVGDSLRLGVTAPSANDVQLLRGKVRDAGLQQVWVTNGFYTVEISAQDLDAYMSPED